MIYASLSVFDMFGAYVTAGSEEALKVVFRDVVYASLRQYEDEFGEVPESFKSQIKKDMDALLVTSIPMVEGFSYDMRIDGNGYQGIISEEEVFAKQEDAEARYREIVDDLNRDIETDDEKWAVFGGGLFLAEQVYEIDELFWGCPRER